MVGGGGESAVLYLRGRGDGKACKEEEEEEEKRQTAEEKATDFFPPFMRDRHYVSMGAPESGTGKDWVAPGLLPACCMNNTHLGHLFSLIL